jgi:hypothetical protein
VDVRKHHIGNCLHGPASPSRQQRAKSGVWVNKILRERACAMFRHFEYLKMVPCPLSSEKSESINLYLHSRTNLRGKNLSIYAFLVQIGVDLHLLQYGVLSVGSAFFSTPIAQKMRQIILIPNHSDGIPQINRHFISNDRNQSCRPVFFVITSASILH